MPFHVMAVRLEVEGDTIPDLDTGNGMPHRIRVLVNNRLHYQKFVMPPEAKSIEVFVEGGEAEIGRLDVWQRRWPDDWGTQATLNSG